MKKIFLFLLFLFPAFSFAKDEITLQEAVKFAYENNLELKSKQYSLKAVKSQKFRAYGGFLPKVAIDINSGSQKAQIGNDPRIEGDADKRSFNVSQSLFSGGNTIFDVKRADSVISKEEAVNDVKEQEIFFGVIEAYFHILYYEELLKIEEANLSSQEKLLEYVRRKKVMKDATKSDLAKVKADYASAFNNVQMAKNNLSSTKVVFTRLTGFVLDEAVFLEKINSRFSYKKMDQLNEENFYEIALRANPELNAAKHSVEAAKHESSMAKSSLSPSVTLTFDSSEQKNSIYFNNRRQRNDSIFLNLHVPLFSSGVEYAQISNSNNLWHSQKYNFEAVRARLKQQIREYLNKVKNTCFAYESAKEQESADEIYVETVKQEERLGAKSIVDLLEAKRELYQAKKSRVSAYYEEILTIFMLKSLIGDLTYDSLNQVNILSDFEEREEENFVKNDKTDSQKIDTKIYKKTAESKKSDAPTN